MLHLFNAGQDKRELFQTCLESLQHDDVLVLLGDAVGYANDVFAAQSKLSEAGAKHFAFCMIAEDVERYGIQLQLEQLTVIDISQLVQIAVEHIASQTWY